MTRILPPIWLLATIVTMILLDHFLPLVTILSYPLTLIGWLPLGLGLLVVLWCAVIFKRHGTPIRPGKDPVSLVAEGPFAISRNPIYLSMIVGLVGVGLLLGSLTPFACIAVFFAIIAKGFIPMEEAALEAAFGDEYLAYRRRVRRWI